MKVKLGNLELPQVQEVATYDRRSLAEHKPPGMPGSLFQNLGRHPTEIVLWGVATGPKAREFAEKLDDQFRAAKPLPFTAKIITGAGIRKALIADLRLQDLAGKPWRFAYGLTLREYITPATKKSASAQDPGIRSDAKNLVNQMASNLTKKKKK
jgi:hypothetical protein